MEEELEYPHKVELSLLEANVEVHPPLHVPQRSLHRSGAFLGQLIDHVCETSPCCLYEILQRPTIPRYVIYVLSGSVSYDNFLESSCLDSDVRSVSSPLVCNGPTILVYQYY